MSMYEKAPEYRYGQWAGNNKGVPEDIKRCATEVFPSQGWIYHQCLRLRGHGPDGRYCKQHAKMIEKNKKNWIPKQ